MKEFYLDLHDETCSCHPDNKNKNKHHLSDFCEYNPERFLFFLGNRFGLITYHRCLSRYDHYDFKKFLIEKVITNSKVFEKWEVNRGVSVASELRNFRLKNKELRKYIQQVNYIYSNASGKEYAITTKTDYLDTICNQDELDKNFKKAEAFLKSKEYDWLLPKLKALYNANTFVRSWDDLEVFKTTEHLIKSINQLTK